MDNRTRSHDHATSMEGADDVSDRAPTQQIRLLAAYFGAGRRGLTDEQAAHTVGLTGSCYWKRCGELRRHGLIELTGDKRQGAAGVRRNVSAITREGEVLLLEKVAIT